VAAKRRTSKARKKPAARKTKKKSSKSWIFWVLLPVGIIGFVLFWYKSEKQVQTSSHFHEIVPKGYKSIGIDVSHHQGEIDWEALFTTAHFDTIIDFVYCKATEGHNHTDTQWERNRDHLNAMGVLNGAYHYFKPKTPPRPQVDHFLSVYKTRSIDLPPVLDVEEEGYTDEDLIAKIRIWAEEVKKRTGMQPIIYTSLSFYETKFRGKMDDYQFWLAAYSREPIFMSDKNVIHWQFSEKGKLPGITEKVDLNVSSLTF
jgi:lysozyme